MLPEGFENQRVKIAGKVATNDEKRGTLICFSRLRVWAMS